MAARPYLASPSLVAEYGDAEGLATRLAEMDVEILSGPEPEPGGYVLFMVQSEDEAA